MDQIRNFNLFPEKRSTDTQGKLTNKVRMMGHLSSVAESSRGSSIATVANSLRESLSVVVTSGKSPSSSPAKKEEVIVVDSNAVRLEAVSVSATQEGAVSPA